MIDVAVLRAMHAAGAPIEAIFAAIEAAQKVAEERIAARRGKDADRQRRRRVRVSARDADGHHQHGVSAPDADGHHGGSVTARDAAHPPSPSPPDGFPAPLPITPTSPSPESSLRSHTSGRLATRPGASELEQTFEQFWQAYPRREGANSRAPAEKKFFAAVQSGVDPDEIIAAAGRYAKEARKLGQERTPYVTRAITWLTERRWRDYPAGTAGTGGTGSEIVGVEIRAGTPEWDAWLAYRRARGEPVARMESEGKYFVRSHWPPGHPEFQPNPPARPASADTND
jgi:hypothetical protein